MTNEQLEKAKSIEKHISFLRSNRVGTLLMDPDSTIKIFGMLELRQEYYGRAEALVMQDIERLEKELEAL